MHVAQPVSSLTHLGAAVASLLSAPFLLRRGWGVWRRMVALTVFLMSCALLFTISGVYHMMDVGTVERAVLQRMDHAAIFVLIAGTFTPPHVILFKGIWRSGMLVLIWTGAMGAIALKLLFFDEMPGWLSLAMYLGMGWTGALSAALLWWRHGWNAMLPFLKPVYVGAMAYSVGGVLEALQWPTLMPGVGPHEVFHIMVLVGAASYWYFIYMIAGGVSLPNIEARRREHMRRLQVRARRAMQDAPKPWQ